LKGLGPIGERLLRAWLSLFHVSPRSELLESFVSAQGGSTPGRLQILPGRYAFALSLTKQGVQVR
jgi:hypothetical protein